MRILDIPFKRSVAVIVVFGFLAFLGVIEYTRLKYELTPPISLPTLTVQAIYPGASPKVVEAEVTKKLEDAVSGIANLNHVSSQSLENASILVLEFGPGTDLGAAIQDVQRLINVKLSSLPAAVKAPSVDRFSLEDQPVIELAVTSKLGPRELYDLVRDSVKPSLGRLGGIGQVTMLGGREGEIRVRLSQARLERYGLSILLVMQRIGAANIEFPAGSIQDADGEYSVRIAGKLKDLDELRDLVILSPPGGGTVLLGDLAEVEEGVADPKTIFRYNGAEAIGLMIVKQSGANSVELSGEVHSALRKLERGYRAQGLHFDVMQDSSVFTLGSARDVVADIVLAILFVGVIMLLFLHDLRNAFIVMMAIPATLLSTFIGMGLAGFSLNLMSLLALTLVIGILVDDSVVVIENIHRHRQLGAGAIEAARTGTREIAFAATSVTLVIIVAFLPVSLAGGLVGNLLKQFGITIVMATAISLFVSLSLTPFLAARLGDSGASRPEGIYARFGRGFDRLFGRLTGLFLSIFDWATAHKAATMASAIGLIVLSLGMLAAGVVGSEFMVKIDRGQFSVYLDFPERTTLAENDRVTQGIVDGIRARPEVASAYAKIGYSAGGDAGYKTAIYVSLVPRARRTRSSEQVGDVVERDILAIPGIKTRVEQLGIIDSGNASPVSYVVSGPDYAQCAAVAEGWAAVMRRVPGTGDVRLSTSDGMPELQVDIDRARLASLGLSLDTVGASLRMALAGNDSLSFSDGEADRSIRIVLDSTDRESTSQVAEIGFINGQGKLIRLKQFATIRSGSGPTVISRTDRENSITITCQAIGRTSGEIDKEIQAQAADLPLPPDVAVKPSGMLSMQGDSFGSLGFALLLSLILIYAILAILFNSLTYPLSVMFSLPFAMIGGLYALALSRQSLNIFSIMAIILLLGLAAKNAILLVDRTLKNRSERGMESSEALREAVATRIKPIFMTTAAMVFGMLPVALGLGSAGEMKQAMGIVLIGGLVFGLVVTMILVPVTFLTVEGLRSRLLSANKPALEGSDAI